MVQWALRAKRIPIPPCTWCPLISGQIPPVDSSVGRRTLAEYAGILARYKIPKLRRSLIQLSTTLALFFLLWAAMWYSLRFSYAVTLALAVPTGLLLVRLFILQHDCGHRSFFRSKRANDWVGCILGLLTMTPYHRWRKVHAAHHATSGDLDRRGMGDVRLLTVNEYLELGRFQKLVYRVHRNSIVLFLIAPLFYFLVAQRFVYMEPRTWKKERASVHLTNLALIVCAAGMSWMIGFWALLLVHLPVMTVAAVTGVWLFYVQHHFESTYWHRNKEWDYVEAALEGSSYYKLPKILQWFTGSIGLHHIHHLDCRIPNYELQRCFDENPEFQDAPRFTFRQSLSCASSKLWDEKANRMVGFANLPVRSRPPGAETVAADRRATDIDPKS